MERYIAHNWRRLRLLGRSRGGTLRPSYTQTLLHYFSCLNHDLGAACCVQAQQRLNNTLKLSDSTVLSCYAGTRSFEGRLHEIG